MVYVEFPVDFFASILSRAGTRVEFFICLPHISNLVVTKPLAFYSHYFFPPLVHMFPASSEHVASRTTASGENLTSKAKVFINGYAICGPGFRTVSEFFDGLQSKHDMSAERMSRKESFDYNFFRYSSQHALHTDPQIRLLLELTFEALVEAGVDDFARISSETGVYVGSSFGDFHNQMLADGVSGYEHIGASGSMLANSISHTFGFQGPSMKIDTACSSSLCALDIACNDLQSGKVKMAIVAGSNLIMDPVITEVFARMKMISTSSPPTCKPFSECADGYVRQEAVAVVLLTTEAETQSLGLVTRAEIAGHGTVTGSGDSITTPSVDGEETLYRKVATMAKAYLAATPLVPPVRYVECHGSGTQVGDAVETLALTNALSQEECVGLYPNVSSQCPLLIGSVKSLVGHTEGASGMTGLIQVLMALEAGQLPPTLHFTNATCNRKCQGLEDGILRVVEDFTPIDHTALAVVNSFGFGGTYAQVMIKGVPNCYEHCLGKDRKPIADANEMWRNINPVLGRTVDTVYELSTKVSKQQFSVVVAPPDMRGGEYAARAFTTPLNKTIYPAAPANADKGTTPYPPTAPPVWLIFTGNGGDWPVMGYELYKHSQVFRDTFDNCSAHLKGSWQCDSLELLLAWQRSHHDMSEHFEKPLQDMMHPFQNILDATVSLTALQICLVQVLIRMHLSPEVCAGFIGHSAGEVAAAYFDGSISLEKALDIAFLRGQTAAAHAERTNRQYAMSAVVGLSKVKVLEAIHRSQCDVEIACHNGAEHLTLSGLRTELDAFETELQDTRLYPTARVYPVNTYGVAFHSRYIDAQAIDDLEIALQHYVFAPNHSSIQRSKKWISSCYAIDEPEGKYVGSRYFARGFQKCVEFERACQHIPDNALILECGPCALFRRVFTAAPCIRAGWRYFSLLERHHDALESVALTYGHLFLEGVDVGITYRSRISPRWAFPRSKQRAIREAFFGWDHSDKFAKYLHQPPRTKAQNPLRSTAVSPPERQRFELDVNGQDSWLRQHRVDGRCLLPAAVYLVIMLEALAVQADQQCSFTHFHIHHPVNLNQQQPLLCLEIEMMDMKGKETGIREVQVECYYTDATMPVASCSISIKQNVGVVAGLDDLPVATNTIVCDSGILYHQLERHGYDYGPDFRVISELCPTKDRASIRAQGVPTSVAEPAFRRKAWILLLDGMLQCALAWRIQSSQYGPCHLPVGIDEICIIQPLLLPTGSISVSCSGAQGGLVVQAHGVTFSAITWQQSRSAELRPAGVDVNKVEMVRVSDRNIGSDTQRPPAPVSSRIVIVDLDAQNFDQWSVCVRDLKRSRSQDEHHTLLVSRAPGFAGFVRALHKEPGYAHIRGLQISCADEVEYQHDDLDAVARHASQVFASSEENVICLFACAQTKTTEAGDTSSEMVLMQEQLMTVETHTRAFPSLHGCYLAHSAAGTGGTFHYEWKPLPNPTFSATPPDTSLATYTIDIEYATLNFRDVMIATGKLARAEAITGYGCAGGGYGLDFAGYRRSTETFGVSGAEVQGTLCIGLGRDCIAERLYHQPAYLLWDLPPGQDLEAWATVPCAYATVYYALCVRGQLSPTHRVLVHCGAGGVGLAAVYLCIKRLREPKVQLFVTCSPTKQQYMHDTFGIPLTHIGDSQSILFQDMVIGHTNKEGVDLVLNSLTGDLMEASIRCLSFGGTMLELGKGEIGPAVIKKLRQNCRQIVMIDLDQVMLCRKSFAPVHQLLADGILTGEVVPLCGQTFSVSDSDMAMAFNQMCSRKRIGKVVLKIGHASLCTRVSRLLATLPWSSSPKKFLVIIVGGLGDLGLCLAQWCASQLGSAGKLVLCSRSGQSNFPQDQVLSDLRRVYHTEVVVHRGDFCDRSEVHKLLHSLCHDSNCVASELWGFFNLAVVTQDMLFENMTGESWRVPFVSKCMITENFAGAVTAPEYSSLTENLQHFVCISSIVAGVGNAGQTNYATANAAMEKWVLSCMAPQGLCIRLGLLPQTRLGRTCLKNHATGQLVHSHLSPLTVYHAMSQITSLIVSGSKGIYTVCGSTSPDRPVQAVPLQAVDSPNSVTSAASVLDIFRKHIPAGLMDIHTAIKYLPLDSLTQVILLGDLEKCLGRNFVSPNNIGEMTPMQVAQHHMSSCGFVGDNADESEGSGSSSASCRRPPDITVVDTEQEDRSSGTLTNRTTDAAGKGEEKGTICDTFLYPIVVIATIGSMATSSVQSSQQKADMRSALLSLRQQTRQPDVIYLVFEDTHTAEELLLTSDEVLAILPQGILITNQRTKDSRVGAVNTAIMRAYTDWGSSDCWLAILDTAKYQWQPNHLESCVFTATSSVAHPGGCFWVMSCVGTALPQSEHEHSLQQLVRTPRSGWFVRCSALLEAGLFDEAFLRTSLVDVDLSIRLWDLQVVGYQQEGGFKQFVTTANMSVDPNPLFSVPEHVTPCQEGTSERAASWDEIHLFVYKHKARMPIEQLHGLVTEWWRVDYQSDGSSLSQLLEGQRPQLLEELSFQREAVTLPAEYSSLPLQMWSDDDDDVKILLRRETHDLFHSMRGSIVDVDSPAQRLKMLVGITTSDVRRVTGLISDLGAMLNNEKHCVVVFANQKTHNGEGVDADVADDVGKLLRPCGFRHYVIRHTDRVVRELYPQYTRSDAKAPITPLPIAHSRTVLQTFLYALSKVEEFEVIGVLDDDMRLPTGWGVNAEDATAGEILLGRALKTPPNPTLMSMRTQLLDFLHAVDEIYARENDEPCRGVTRHSVGWNSWPSLQVFRDLQDQYYDLSSSRWNHLELPRRFHDPGSVGNTKEDIQHFVERCRYKILVGDPLAREAICTDCGETTQRGGCMVLFRAHFDVLATEQVAPVVTLASQRVVSSRRSDSFWVQTQREKHDKKAVVLRHLSLLHDNSHDVIPGIAHMRETVALEMIGAILCRPGSADRISFAGERLGALQASLARMRGLCKTFRGRAYFTSCPGLEAFIAYLEQLLEVKAWQRDVFAVVQKQVAELCDWTASTVAPREVVRMYALDPTERQCLRVQSIPQRGIPACLDDYPDVLALREGPVLPIPCLHRIHNEEVPLVGAHFIQETLGMSLPLSVVEQQLEKLATLVKVVRQFSATKNSKMPPRKAFVTIDDGFRDALLLRPIFQKLSTTLQPVLFLPSSNLRDGQDGVIRRHLPLTCLYDYCYQNRIEPEDKDRLGKATRSSLKLLSEKEQYQVLEEAHIPTQLSTHDLLLLTDLQELSAEGWFIGAHGPDHSDLTQTLTVGVAEFVNELTLDMNFLRLNGWTPWFAWPEGQWNARLGDALQKPKCGVLTQFGLAFPPMGEPLHPAIVPRIAWLGGARTRRILVTGSSGFLGRHLVLLLQGYGYDVITYDLIQGKDILNKEALLKSLREMEITACVHLAAVADLNEAEAHPEEARKVNIGGTRNVVECCDAADVRLLFASTCCVYGNNGITGSSNELSPVNPTELYAETKLQGEEIVLNSPRISALKHVVMRLATFYGPGMREALATSVFLRAAESRQPITIHGSGEQTRCFTHVHDIAQGIRVILQATKFSGVVNVTDDKAYSVRALAYLAMQVAGTTVELIHVPDRVGQITRSHMDNSRLRGLLGGEWQPTVSLVEGLQGCCTSTVPTTVTSTSPSACSAVPAPVVGGIQSVPPIVRMRELAHTRLPTHYSPCSSSMVYVTECFADHTQVIVWTVGDVQHSTKVAVRMHSECLFGDILGSLKCDCGPQLSAFMASLDDAHPGILVYIKGHEGRGAGLVTKTRAYHDVDVHPEKHHNAALLDAGAVSVDTRHYAIAAEVLLHVLLRDSEKAVFDTTNEKVSADLAEETVLVLHTNNLEKVKAVTGVVCEGIQRCPGRRFRCQQQHISGKSHCNPHNRKYLLEKEADNGQDGLGICHVNDVELSVTPAIPDNIDELPPGVTTKVNEKKFDAEDTQALLEFFAEYGFVIVRGVVTPEQLERARSSHKQIMHRLLGHVNAHVGEDQQIEMAEFSETVSQLRDLHLREYEDNVFKELVHNTATVSLGSLARQSMAAVDPDGQWDAIKLLHDHTITKPAGTRVSKTIPLHQDRMFWPVDIPGCSTWVPFEDVPLNGGCMELLTLATHPHKHPQQQGHPAVDFMAVEWDSGVPLVLGEDSHPVRWLLPMEAGDTLVFSSTAWHRSSPNTQLHRTRTAYIQTWVHPKASWRPDLVPWHPVNEHLLLAKCTPGENLTGERHPVVSIRECTPGENLTGERHPAVSIRALESIYARGAGMIQAATKQVGSHISMFDASDVVSTQILNIMRLLEGASFKKQPLVEILKHDRHCNQLAISTVERFYPNAVKNATESERYADLFQESGCTTMRALILWTLRRLQISAAAYACDRSRNVFNSAYSAWWRVAGESWNTFFLHGPFRPHYHLCKTDISRFLQYIGESIEMCDDQTGAGQLKLLEAIMRGAMAKIPFQNITMLTRLQSVQEGPNTADRRCPPTLGELIEDMIQGRGGLCSTRNPFLYLLLRSMGYAQVRFVAGSIFCPPSGVMGGRVEGSKGGTMLQDAHVALLVGIEQREYWVDIANGWPYLRPLPLDSQGEDVIAHPFAETRVVTKSDNSHIYYVQHRLRHEKEWRDNYYFDVTPMTFDYDCVFGHIMQKHYDPEANFGPFLNNLRFNLWTMDDGILVRDDVVYWCCPPPGVQETTKVDLWRKPSELEHAVQKATSFSAPAISGLMQLVQEAWAQCQKNKGVVREAEKITVTGGFFDQTATGYIGLVTVWRRCEKSTQPVMGITFRILREYAPTMYPVINKGFSGGSWYRDELYVCWPNRVAVVSPTSNWTISRHLDHVGFNDLHHVHASENGIWVANTGCDTIEHLDVDGTHRAQYNVDTWTKVDAEVGTEMDATDRKFADVTGVDLRSQHAHTARRGHDVEHVNYVSPISIGGDGHSSCTMLATCLQSKRLLSIRDTNTPSINLFFTLDPLYANSPPHEGFVHIALRISPKPLIWNSTVDGHVVASDPESGAVFRSWNLSDFPGVPRGWTRGLCIMDDGFLVGSTIIHHDAKPWLTDRHDNDWSFDPKNSQTAVVYIPFDASCAYAHNDAIRSVEFLSDRKAKIFSLLHTPSGVPTTANV